MLGFVGINKAEEQAAKTFLIIGGTVLVGALLLSDPRCKRGCRTVAEHLVEHGIQDFFSTLFLS